MNYHDFVIKDGKFIGQFEKMYQQHPDPWHQSKMAESKSRILSAASLRHFGIKSVVEFGCGLGYFTNYLNQNVPDLEIIGVDTSETAIEKAKSLFPDLAFKADNVENIKSYRDYEAIFFPEITWYILPDLRKIFSDMMEASAGKLFLHNLAFYPPEQQKYGREYFTTIDGFIEFCPFRLLEKNVMHSYGDNSAIETHCVFKIEQKTP